MYMTKQKKAHRQNKLVATSGEREKIKTED